MCSGLHIRLPAHATLPSSGALHHNPWAGALVPTWLPSKPTLLAPTAACPTGVHGVWAAAQGSAMHTCDTSCVLACTLPHRCSLGCSPWWAWARGGPPAPASPCPPPPCPPPPLPLTRSSPSGASCVRAPPPCQRPRPQRQQQQPQRPLRQRPLAWSAGRGQAGRGAAAGTAAGMAAGAAAA